jgi:hypothetical protein
MKKLWNKIVWSNPKVKIFATVSVIMFTIFMMLFESYGNKPIFFLKVIEGKITEINDNERFRSGKVGVEVKLPCMELNLDSFKEPLIHKDRTLAKRFNPGQKVKLWIYHNDYDYFFIKAKNVESNEIIVNYNERKGVRVFGLLIVSIICVLFSLYVYFFRKY